MAWMASKAGQCIGLRTPRSIAPASALFVTILAAGAAAGDPGGPQDAGALCAYDATVISAPDGPFGPEKIVLNDINDAGVAVGSVSYLLSTLPCLWTLEDGVDVLPQAPGLESSSATAINNNGWILVNGETASGLFKAFVYVPVDGGYAPVEIVGPHGYVQALGINDKNQMVGVQKMPPMGGSPVDAGFLWTPGQPKVDIQFPGWKAARCTGINNDGVICGNVGPTSASNPSGPGVRAFVLESGALTVIEPPLPYVRSSTTRINGAGLVGGDVQFGSGPNTQSAGFFLDIKSGEFVVVPPPNGAFRWTLRDLNDEGVASGVLSDGPDGSLDPCIATKGGVTAIESLFAQQYAAATSSAMAIADDGAVLVNKAWEVLYSVPHLGGADLDCDGMVGPNDLALVLGEWGMTASFADLDTSSVVDGADIGVLLGEWSE